MTCRSITSQSNDKCAQIYKTNLSKLIIFKRTSKKIFSVMNTLINDVSNIDKFHLMTYNPKLKRTDCAYTKMNLFKEENENCCSVCKRYTNILFFR